MGRVIGTAGGSLRSAGWAANKDVAKAGRDGERSVAKLLEEAAMRADGPTVMHDLDVPGTDANIDHLVIAGDRVRIVDAKQWKPGTYVSVFGRAYRSTHSWWRWERFKPAETVSVMLAARDIGDIVSRAGGQQKTPVVLVLPSDRRKTVNVRFLRIPGATVISGRGVDSFLKTIRHPAYPNVEAVFEPLVRGHHRHKDSHGWGPPQQSTPTTTGWSELESPPPPPTSPPAVNELPDIDELT